MKLHCRPKSQLIEMLIRVCGQGQLPLRKKLWSPQVLTKDVDDMYRRLDFISSYLTKRGTRHQTGYEKMVKVLAGNNSIEPVKKLVDVLEEVKYVERLGNHLDLTTRGLLNEVADVAQPESYQAWKFNKMLEALIMDSTHQVNWNEIQTALEEWTSNDSLFSKAMVGNQRLEKMNVISIDLSKLCALGLESLDNETSGKKLSADEMKILNNWIMKLDKPHEGALIAIMPGIKQLGNDLK